MDGAFPVLVGWGGIGPKQEGDGRSHEGIFGLGPVFGYSSDPPPGLELPTDPTRVRVGAQTAGVNLHYEPMTPGALCVDDPESGFYNRILDPDTFPDEPSTLKDWTRAETMRRDLAHGDDLYRWGVVVRHNEERLPGVGSCIFLHVWRDRNSPTDGCTAMREEDLLEVIRWLSQGSGEGKGPLLVQGTRAFLKGLRREDLLPYEVPRLAP